jgi:hypothetical protein
MRHAMRHAVRCGRLGGLALFLALAPSPAHAQAPPPAAPALPSLLRPGDLVSVTDQAGQRTKGRVVASVPGTLTLFVGRKDPSHLWKVDDVAKVVRHDSLVNGTLLGLAAGAAAGWIGVPIVCGRNDPECEGNVAPIMLGVGAAVAAAAGAIVDASITRTVYVGRTRRAPPSISVSPILSMRQRGVTITARF